LQAAPFRPITKSGGFVHDTFNSLRRDFCVPQPRRRRGRHPSVSQAATKEKPFQSDGLFNVRNYGAAGDGKTLDTTASTTLLMPAATAAA